MKRIRRKGDVCDNEGDEEMSARRMMEEGRCMRE